MLNSVRKLLKIDYLHERNILGKNINIAIIDTGLVYGHKDLMDNVIAFYDGVNKKNRMYDDNGHGTHVAGIICGTGKMSSGEFKGIAPEAGIIVVKALNRQGRGRINVAVDCIKWILHNAKKYNIRIVNVSIGTLAGQNSEDDKDNIELLYWIEKLWESGMVVVAAAGNNGPENGTITVPGICKKVITVGVSDNVNLAGGKRTYSGRGPADCVMKPEIVAPGASIMSCSANGRGYASKSGSSMATPIVSGVIALILSKEPELTNKQVKKILMKTAIDLKYDKECQGWGRISTDYLFLKK